ncbi:Sodium/hydrogen exchanger 7 [Hondaea fermentalgiana]|uniref:Sodium/hydrogen exchanger 7 n=1 Tax=Hondaea fermentalgiana TaxID=2315210 RepID=A0A2R5G3U0_9STRA|nr:Sodium/hydrogen exchanger 7 [Hondaea fermentalgiana]|eukprot:GBG25205.1 Sodium/hydrogen exchanger 7 [Hondaea fermentalgiana]
MSESDEAVEGQVVAIVVLIGLSLCVAGLVEALPPKILAMFPQSVLVLLIGLVGGLFGLHFSRVRDNDDPDSLVSALEIDPEGIQLLFLPPLIFSELFKMNVHVFFNVSIQAILLAFPGVLISMCLTALFPVYILPNSWEWFESLAFGGMLSATDPVAVLAVLHSLNASKHLSTLIAGESVLNDGSAIVVVTLFLNLQAGMPYSAGDIVAFSFQETLGSLALGTAFGLAMMCIFPLLKENPTPLVALTFAIPYLCFASALVTEMSGVLALVPLGLITNAWGRATIVGAVAERMEHFWNQAEFFANSLLFVIAGLYIADDLLSGAIKGSDWGYLFLLYALLMVIRGIAIMLLYPALVRLGYGFTLPEATVTVWGGLRGAVGLTLSFQIRASEGVSYRVGEQATFYMGGIVMLTLLVNATTSGPLVKYFNLQRAADRRILAELNTDFREVASRSLAFAGATDTQVHTAFAGVHEPVDPVAPTHKGSTQEQTPSVTGPSPVSTTTTEDGVALDELETMAAKRRHFLLAQSVTFDHLLGRGVIPRSAWFLVMQSIDVELDKKDSEIGQWHAVLRQPLVRFFIRFIADEPLRRFLHAKNASDESFLMRDLADHPDPPQTLGKASTYALTLMAYIAFAYLRAHEDARAAIDALRSEANTLGQHRAALVQESLQDCRAPAKFLTLVRHRHPVILQHIKAVQLATAIEWDLLDRATRLADLGLLEHSELHPLLELAEHLSAKCKPLNLPLKADPVYPPSGDFARNPDFYPFPALTPHKVIQSKASAEDVELAITNGPSESEIITAPRTRHSQQDIRNLESRVINDLAGSHWYRS